MPSRYFQRQFYPQTYHHIFNRGAYKQKVFIADQDYLSFLDILSFYLKYPTGKSLTRMSKKTSPANNYKSLLMPYCLVAYCLMPNHFHLLLLQQTEQPTLSDLLKRLSITYAMYFQEHHQHSGAVFQGRYKSILINSGNQLLYLSKYIHLNPSNLVGSQPTKYRYSSLTAFIDKSQTPAWLHPELILNNFFPNSPNPHKKYHQFVTDKSDQNQEIINSVVLE